MNWKIKPFLWLAFIITMAQLLYPPWSYSVSFWSDKGTWRNKYCIERFWIWEAPYEYKAPPGQIRTHPDKFTIDMQRLIIPIVAVWFVCGFFGLMCRINNHQKQQIIADGSKPENTALLRQKNKDFIKLIFVDVMKLFFLVAFALFVGVGLFFGVDNIFEGKFYKLPLFMICFCLGNTLVFAFTPKWRSVSFVTFLIATIVSIISSIITWNEILSLIRK